MSLVSERARSGPCGPRFEFRVLGHLEIIVRGSLLTEGPLKQRALLAYLRLPPNQVDPAGRLVEARLALADRRYDDAARLLGGALSRWRGSALSDLVEAGISWPVITYLDDMRLTALEDRIDADLRLGRHSDLAGELAQLVAVTPLRERLWERLIVALYRAGRQADALSAYRDCRRVLIEELGIEPNQRLCELERAILTQDTQYLMRLPESPMATAPPVSELFREGRLSLSARSA